MREWMGPGGFLGLQNRWGAAFVVLGGFDSLALPPVLGVQASWKVKRPYNCV